MEQRATKRGISEMCKGWFLDYASYVILERAVPSLLDGMKPVQRRILHAMFEVEDGRYNKVANIVGRTMQYHPHGDASIGDALVQVGQKNLLIDTQGNWGNIYTGDGAAASRYIEARLTPFAKEVVFNPKITQWTLSYDGRLKEPLFLPVKFCLLLYHGAEGIAVGLSTKVMPHNFNEIIDASIKHLQGKEFSLYPDFITAGIVDVSNYKDGRKGGRIKLRATVNQRDPNTLVISDLPYGKSTGSLIESIIKANDNGKISIKKIEDNTSDKVEILIYLQQRTNLDTIIRALYKFTDCEVSIAPQACVIEDDKPVFISVSQILTKSVECTVDLLRKELELRKQEIERGIFYTSLERIFIQHKVYRNIEQEKTWEGVLSAIAKGIEPYTKELTAPASEDDMKRLTEIPIKRISKFDIEKSNDLLLRLEGELESVSEKLLHLTKYAIDYFRGIKRKYGKQYPRKTKIQSFDSIEASEVAVANLKLRVDRDEGFIGTSLKTEEHLFDCSAEDYILVVQEDGTYIVTKVSEKTFFGKDILHVSLFKKNDVNETFNLVYRDGKIGKVYAKRVRLSPIKSERKYDFTKGTAGSQILYISRVEDVDTELVEVCIKTFTKKKNALKLDFKDLPIQSKSVIGKMVTPMEVEKIDLKKTVRAKRAARELYFDQSKGGFNFSSVGVSLGMFGMDDKVLLVLSNGILKCVNPHASGVYISERVFFLQRFNPGQSFKILYRVKGAYFFKNVELPDKEGTYILDDREITIVKAGYYQKAKLRLSYKNGVKPVNIDVSSRFPVRTLRSKPYEVPSVNVNAVDIL